MKKQHKDEIKEISGIASTYAKLTEASIDKDIEGDRILKEISGLLSGKYNFDVDTKTIPAYDRHEHKVNVLNVLIDASNYPVRIRAFIVDNTPGDGGEDDSCKVTVMVYVNGAFAADLGDIMSKYSTATLERYLDDLVDKGILKDKDEAIKESIAQDAFNQKKAKQLAALLFEHGNGSQKMSKSDFYVLVRELTPQAPPTVRPGDVPLSPEKQRHMDEVIGEVRALREVYSDDPLIKEVATNILAGCILIQSE